MANASPVSVGRVNAGGSEDALFLKVFAGEVLGYAAGRDPLRDDKTYALLWVYAERNRVLGQLQKERGPGGVSFKLRDRRRLVGSRSAV